MSWGGCTPDILVKCGPVYALFDFTTVFQHGGQAAIS